MNPKLLLAKQYIIAHKVQAIIVGVFIGAIIVIAIGLGLGLGLGSSASCKKLCDCDKLEKTGDIAWPDLAPYICTVISDDPSICMYTYNSVTVTEMYWLCKDNGCEPDEEGVVGCS